MAGIRRWADTGIIVFEIFGIALIVLFGGMLFELSNTLKQAAEDRFYMMRYAEQLRDSSDELTHFARSYVVTGDTRYKDSYFDVLHIRQGTLPRPERYYGPYWDLNETQRALKHPAGKKISIKAVMAKLPYTEEERALLRRAEDNSDELVHLEVEAFNAMVGRFPDANGSYAIQKAPDRQQAVALLYSPEYFRAKSRIMEPIDTFITILDTRTQTQLSTIKEMEKVYFILLFSLISLFIAGNVIVYFILNGRTRELYRLLGIFDRYVIATKTDCDGVITYISSAFAKVSGYRAEELIGKRHDIIRHPDVPEAFYNALWKTIRAGKTWEGELKNRSKYGNTYWVKYGISPEYNLRGTLIGYSGVGQDVTARKRLEELSRTLEQRVVERTRALAESEQFVQTLLDTQEQIIITTDGKYITSANQAFVDFYDQPLEIFKQKYECICNTFDDNVPEGYLHKIMDHETWVDYLLLHSKRVNKAQITRKGVPHVFSITAARMPREGRKLILVVLTDITESEQAHRQLREAGERLQMAYEIGNLGWWDWHVGNDEMYTNDILYTMLGYKPNAFPPNFAKWVSLIHPEDLEHIQKVIQKLLSGEVSNVHEIYRHLGANGEWIWVEDYCKAIEHDDHGRSLRLLGININIDKNKRLADSLTESNKKISDSLQYASLIQHALIPEQEIFEACFADYFVLWEPRDVVGGDIYFAERLSEHEIIVFVVDCTGHGVPGAFVTMLVKAIKRQIVSSMVHSRQAVSPARFLSLFDRHMRYLLKQEGNTMAVNTGFEAGILYYNNQTDFVRFAGANIPLFVLQGGDVEVIPGDRCSIGYYRSGPEFLFTDHEINVMEGTALYMTTDGYLDQNGGEKGFPFGKKRFKALLRQGGTLSMPEQRTRLLEALASYRGAYEPTDDITVLGLRIKRRDATVSSLPDAGPVVSEYAGDRHDISQHFSGNGRLLSSYKGVLSQPMITEMVETLEKAMTAYGWRQKVMVDLITVFIELSQNMMRYAKPESGTDADGLPHEEISIGVQRDGKQCCITSKNVVNADDKQTILQRLSQLEGRDKKALRHLYRTLRRNGEMHAHGESAGIGFAEIGRHCDRMEYAFADTGLGQYYFILKATIQC